MVETRSLSQQQSIDRYAHVYCFLYRANGVLWQTLKHRRMFFVASQAIRYRHGIPPFHAYQVKSQMIYWDGPWIYFLHQFQDPSSGKMFAEGLCRAIVKQRGKDVSFTQMISEVHEGPVPPQPTEVPDVVKGFLEWDAASRSSMEATPAREKTTATCDAVLPKAPQSVGARIWTELKRSMNRP